MGAALISLIPFFTREAVTWLQAWAAQRRAEEAMKAAGATEEAIAAFKAFLTSNASLATKDVYDTLASIPPPVQQ